MTTLSRSPSLLSLSPPLPRAPVLARRDEPEDFGLLSEHLLQCGPLRRHGFFCGVLRNPPVIAQSGRCLDANSACLAAAAVLLLWVDNRPPNARVVAVSQPFDRDSVRHDEFSRAFD